MSSRTVAVVLVALAAAVVAAAADGPHPFTAHDLLAMERISDPQPSPDGERVVFTVRSTDLEANRGRTDLWLVELAGGPPLRLTTHQAGDSHPRWSADGERVLFLSSRSGSSQVWSIAPDGGEAVPVTDLPLDVGGFVVPPRGGGLAVFLEVFPDCADLACTVERLAEGEASAANVRAYDRLFVRHWDTWKDGRRSHLFVLPEGGGEPVDVTRGMEADVPSKPFGGAEEVTFTPDGEALVFTARDAGAAEAWSTDFDLWLAPADGSAPPRCLTEGNEAWDTLPVFSPDGSTLAYLAMTVPGYESDRFRIVLRGWPDGEARVLTEGWDRSPSSLAFSPDGRTIYATAADLGQVALFAVDVASGEAERLLADGHVRSPGIAGERLVFGRDSLTSPVELFSTDLTGGDLRALTALNAGHLEGVAMGEPEPFTFAGWNGETVHGWLVRPAGWRPGESHPLAFLIHGGPQGSFANDFHYRWNPQTYAGAGYAAVMIDFHGSTGYGQAFTDSIRHDWGGKPLEDLQRGLAHVLEEHPWIDGDRACALGASYGGYMINWIAGRWPERFRCLVNHDGVFDQRSMYFTTEELWFPEREHGGPYWEAAESYERHNPVRFVDRWRTPMLVIHGSLDYRVPETQGLAAFTALERQGIPGRLLVFPEENHWVLSPASSIRWHEEVLAWLERWTAPSGGG